MSAKIVENEITAAGWFVTEKENEERTRKTCVKLLYIHRKKFIAKMCKCFKMYAHSILKLHMFTKISYNFYYEDYKKILLSHISKFNNYKFLP